MRRIGGALLLVLLCFGSTEPVRATTFVPLSVEDLTRSSVASVIGTVASLIGVESHEGRIFTLVAVQVEQVLTGELPAPVITLKESGGVVGGRREVVFGTPSFQVGERVLLFLTVRRDGSLRTNHLALGKFRLEAGTDGRQQAVQHFEPGTRMIGAPPPRPAAPLDEILSAVRRALPPAAGAATARPAPRAEPPEAGDPSLLHEVTDEFMLLGPGRFFEADQGTPISFLIDQKGDAILGFAASRQSVDDAAAAWTNVATASIALQDGGLTDDLAVPCAGPHKVRFNDPDDDIPDPFNCSGTLGVGGFCTNSADTKFFNGTSFTRAARALLTLANGWQGCAVWNPCNVAEVATHEIGHAIGLDHSSENFSEPNFPLADATMYFLTHFDGRCAGVRTDDIQGISFIYPTAIPPTITTANPLHTGAALMPYRQTFAATGGVGPFTWSLVDGDFPGLSLTSNGALSGTPLATGTVSLQVNATDTNGDSHTKAFDLTIGNRPPCIGDCDGDGSVTVNEIIKGVNIALGGLALDKCPSFQSSDGKAVTISDIVKAVNAALNGCQAT